MSKKYFDINDEEIKVDDYIVWVAFDDVCHIKMFNPDPGIEHYIGATPLDNSSEIIWFSNHEVRKITEREAFHAKLGMSTDGLVQLRKPFYYDS
jgi:hypothetical protein